MLLRRRMLAAALFGPALAGCATAPADISGLPNSVAVTEAVAAAPPAARPPLRATMTAEAWSALGATLFMERCSSCHDQGGAPPRSVLARNTPSQVVEAIQTGLMAPIAMFLTADQKQAVSEFVAGQRDETG